MKPSAYKLAPNHPADNGKDWCLLCRKGSIAWSIWDGGRLMEVGASRGLEHHGMEGILSAIKKITNNGDDAAWVCLPDDPEEAFYLGSWVQGGEGCRINEKANGQLEEWLPFADEAIKEWARRHAWDAFNPDDMSRLERLAVAFALTVGIGIVRLDGSDP